MISIACVVEGHGEVEALPVLVRRIACENEIAVLVRKPHRVSRSKPWSEWARAVALQQSALNGTAGGVIVLLDADDDEPQVIQEDIAKEVNERTGRTDTVICVAVREYESWFLASIDSLRSHPLVRDDASFEGNPDSVRNAKGMMRRLMETSYSEVLHMPKFTALIDLGLSRERSQSFAQFYDKLLALLAVDQAS